MGKAKDKSGDTEIMNRDMESVKQKKMPYPKAVFFIVTNEFCERFSFYGMRAVLTLYLTSILLFSEDDATVIYHVFVMCSYFTPLFGAMLADGLLGKFKTILYLSIVYATGSIVLSLAATPTLNLPATEISMLGLALIALGTGGIKPCVAAFGGDQFVLPQQAEQLATFFSFFYMSINLGAFISTFTTPIMREDVECFGDDTCYSLAFAVPAGLMVVSILVFLAGKFLYREIKPKGNVVVKVAKCIGHAIKQKWHWKEERDHWLDHADDEYEPRFIHDVKIVLRVLVLYIPLPFFWALYDQQGSRWTLQATRMDGVVWGYTIKPDQVQVLSAFFILCFIPLFDGIIYPVLAKCGLLTKSLQRLTTGGVLAGLAFVISGLLELQLEKTYPNTLTPQQANINFMNTLPCAIQLRLDNNLVELPPFANHIFEAVNATEYNLYMQTPGNGTGIHLTLNETCADFTMPEAIHFKADKSDAEKEEQKGTEAAHDGGGFSYMITFNVDNQIKLAYGNKSDDREKPQNGNPKLRFLVGGDYFILDENSTLPQGKLSVYVYVPGFEGQEAVIDRFVHTDPNNVGFSSETVSVDPVKHKLILVHGRSNDDLETGSVSVEFPQEFDFKLGASYVISISRNGTYTDFISGPLEDFENPASYGVVVHTITKESSLHMFWLLPQYIVLTAGEIMFSITGLEFSYSQSPVSMKSVMQSAWLMTVAFGNLIVVIIAELKFFERQSMEFFLFAILMFVDMVVFAVMAYFYVPAQLEDPLKKKQDS